jgi:hypothetical protein
MIAPPNPLINLFMFVVDLRGILHRNHHAARRRAKTPDFGRVNEQATLSGVTISCSRRADE